MRIRNPFHHHDTTATHERTVTTVNRSQQRWIKQVLPLARDAANDLHVPVSAVLAQWADETAWGTSELFRDHNNFAGVTGDADGQVRRLGATVIKGGFLSYPSQAVGVQGYVMRWNDPVYANTRNAWHADNSPIAVAKAMEASPWAAGHYDFRDLEVIIEDNQLTQYDHGDGPAPGPTPHPEQPCTGLAPGPAPHGHRTLRIGMHGPDVAQLQELLAAHHFIPVNSIRPDGKGDGIFGPGTTGAVVGLQEHHGLRADGIVGRQTWCVLGVR